MYGEITFVNFSRQELHRIDEQFQRERAEREKREEEERKWRMEKEEEEKKFDQQEVKDFKENRPVTLRSLPPALLPKPALPVRTQVSIVIYPSIALDGQSPFSVFLQLSCDTATNVLMVHIQPEHGVPVVLV